MGTGGGPGVRCPLVDFVLGPHPGSDPTVSTRTLPTSPATPSLNGRRRDDPGPSERSKGHCSPPPPSPSLLRRKGSTVDTNFCRTGETTEDKSRGIRGGAGASTEDPTEEGTFPFFSARVGVGCPRRRRTPVSTTLPFDSGHRRGRSQPRRTTPQLQWVSGWVEVDGGGEGGSDRWSGLWKECTGLLGTTGHRGTPGRPTGPTGPSTPPPATRGGRDPTSHDNPSGERSP